MLRLRPFALAFLMALAPAPGLLTADEEERKRLEPHADAQVAPALEAYRRDRGPPPRVRSPRRTAAWRSATTRTSTATTHCATLPRRSSRRCAGPTSSSLREASSGLDLWRSHRGRPTRRPVPTPLWTARRSTVPRARPWRRPCAASRTRAPWRMRSARLPSPRLSASDWPSGTWGEGRACGQALGRAAPYDLG